MNYLHILHIAEEKKLSIDFIHSCKYCIKSGSTGGEIIMRLGSLLHQNKKNNTPEYLNMK